MKTHLPNASIRAVAASKQDCFGQSSTALDTDGAKRGLCRALKKRGSFSISLFHCWHNVGSMTGCTAIEQIVCRNYRQYLVIIGSKEL